MKVIGICYFLLTLLTPYDQNIDFCFPLTMFHHVDGGIYVIMADLFTSLSVLRFGERPDTIAEKGNVG